MVPSRRLAIAKDLAIEFRKRYGPRLVAAGVLGSVGRGDDRPGSDIDFLIVSGTKATRNPMDRGTHPESRIIEGVPVTFLEWTPEEARDEVVGSQPGLNVALAGWRSLQPLYDPAGLLARLRHRSFHPTPAQWRRAARQALLETFEDLGKLRNAIEARDADEMREMAIWYTDGAMGCLFDLERFVLSTGRRAFIEARRFGRTGREIRRLRYGDLYPGDASLLAESTWSALLVRGRRRGIRLPRLFTMGAASVPFERSRGALAGQSVEQVRRHEGRNLVAAGLYGSVAKGDDRRFSDIDLLLVLDQIRGRPRGMRAIRNTLISVSRMTPAEIRGEVTGAPWNLPEVLSGWRSMRILHDPSLLRWAIRRSWRPSARMYERAARENLLEGYEFLGKLKKAARAKDRDETREMAIWFSSPAMFALLCLDRRVVETGRRLLAELRQLGPLGRDIRRLRTEWLNPRAAVRSANAVWDSLLLRAHRAGIRLPNGLDSGGLGPSV